MERTLLRDPVRMHGSRRFAGYERTYTEHLFACVGERLSRNFPRWRPPGWIDKYTCEFPSFAIMFRPPGEGATLCVTGSILPDLGVPPEFPGSF